MITVIGPDDGKALDFGGLGVRFMATGEGFSLVEHPIAPRTLGVQIGDEVRYARAGDLVFKPRGIWHAFWNRDDEPARLLEILSPAGFEQFFAELAALLPPQREAPDLEAIPALQQRFGLRMDMASAATICEREGLPLVT